MVEKSNDTPAVRPDSDNDTAMQHLADRPDDDARRKIVGKAIKIGAAAPVMLALFAGKKASATTTGSFEPF